MENSEINSKSYPIIDGGRRHFAEIPLQVQKEDIFKTAINLTIGKWIAVNIHLTGGYTFLVAPVEFETYEECYEACKRHNEYIGLSEENVEYILESSMISLAMHDGKVGEL